VKPYAVDGQYGSAGFKMAWTPGAANYNNPFTDATGTLPSWVTSMTAPTEMMAFSYDTYANIDDPSQSAGTDVTDAKVGQIYSLTGPVSDYMYTISFDIGAGTPQLFRVGVLVNNADSAWWGGGVRLTGPDNAVRIEYAVPATAEADWVFFDVNTGGATSGTFTIAPKTLANGYHSLGGITFDVPTAVPEPAVLPFAGLLAIGFFRNRRRVSEPHQ
jgi:hypothetical protein